MYCHFIHIILVAAFASRWEFAATIRSATFQGNQDKGQILESSQYAKEAYKFKEGLQHMNVEGNAKKPEMMGPGSKPPKCEQKCRGCNPCVAAQVPETSRHLGVEYTNYEPEGWVCKCGSSFFIP